MPVRILVRQTQSYHDTMLKLYHRNALVSEERRAATSGVLTKLLTKVIREEFAACAESEQQQLERGDIPYIYTYGELPCNFMTKNEARDLG